MQRCFILEIMGILVGIWVAYRSVYGTCDVLESRTNMNKTAIAMSTQE